MVHFSVTPSLISSLVLVFLLFAVSSYATKVVVVDAICNQTKNSSFCSCLLNSKPGGVAGADLVSFGQYTIDVVRDNVTNTINLIKSLIAQSAGDPKAKNHYKECWLNFDYYNGALGDIEHTQQRLKSGDYEGMNIAASAMMTHVDNCISGESPSDPPYHDTSLLPKYANVVDQVAEIILVISKYLMQN